MGFATAAAIAGIAASGYQVLKGAQAESAANKAAEEASKAAKDMINDAARIAEADKFKSLQVPTLGLELAQQNMQARQAQELQGLQDIGAAGVLGGLTAANQQARAEDLQLAAQADQMQYQRDSALAQNAQQLEQNRVQRELALNQSKLALNQSELAGAQTAAAEARQNQAVGIQGGLGAVSNAAMLSTYKDIYGKGGNGSNFLGELGYALGLGGTNATPVASTTVTAQDAFKPTIQKMAPNNIQPQVANPGLTSMQANLAQQQQLNALRDPQAQFDKQYRWNPYTGQWGLR